MKLIKKGFESIRVTYNGDRKYLKNYENLEKRDKTINEIKEEIKKWMFIEIEENFWEDEEDKDKKTILEENIEELRKKRKELMGFIDDYDYIKNIIFNLIDNKNFFLEKFQLRDRNIFKINFVENKSKKHTILEIDEYNDFRKWWVWSVKLNWMFRRIKEETIFTDILYEIENIILNQHFHYLNRIDFYLDFEWSIQEFLKTTTIRGFKKGWIVEGWIFKSFNEWFQIKENSTIYWGAIKRDYQRVVARLYNKRVDTVNKGKLKYYSYLNENIRRFEVSLEAQEIQDRKKLFQEKTVWEFIRFIYKNVLLKQIYINGYYYYKFDIQELKDEEVLYSNIKKAKKRKRTLKGQHSFKMQHYRGYTRTMIGEMGEKEYMEYLDKIRNWQI